MHPGLRLSNWQRAPRGRKSPATRFAAERATPTGSPRQREHSKVEKGFNRAGCRYAGGHGGCGGTARRWTRRLRPRQRTMSDAVALRGRARWGRSSSRAESWWGAPGGELRGGGDGERGRCCALARREGRGERMEGSRGRRWAAAAFWRARGAAGATQGRVASGATRRRPHGVRDLMAVGAARASARTNAGGQAGPASPIGPKTRPRPTKPGKILFPLFF
jgi:hypothetical protein